MGLKDWLEKRTRDERFTEDINAMDSRAHSRAYHRFFAGYTEVKKVKQGGLGYTIDRVYTGQYFERRMGKGRSIALKALYLALYLAAAAAFVMSAVARVEINSVWYIVAPEALSAAALVWAGVGVVNYLIAPMKMTKYEYNSSSRSLIRSSAVSFALLLVTAGAVCLYLFMKKPADLPETTACAVRCAVGAAAMIALNRIECGVKYEKYASEHSGKINGVEIQ